MPSIIDHEKYDARFPAENVLEDSQDFWDDEDIANYWVTGDGKVGDEAYFIMDLGCISAISRITVKNTHSAHHNDRGTKKFSVFSSNSASGPWNKLLTKTLPDPRNNVPVNKTFTVRSQGQYVKVEVDSFYGWGGGLQFFQVN